MEKENFAKKLIKFLFNLLNIIFIVLMLVLAFISIFKKEWFEAFITWLGVAINGLGYWNYLIIFTSSFIEAFPVLGVVVPGQNILMLVGGFFGKIGKENLFYVGIIASIGAILGNYVGYLLGKKYGDIFFEKYGNWFGIGLTEVKYLKKGIDKWGAWGIIFGKFHQVTRAFLPFIAGSMGMKSKSFMIYNIIGSIIWATTMVTLGILFVEYYKIILDYIGYIFIGIFVGIGFYIYKFKKEEFKKYMMEKNEEMERLYSKK